MGEADIDALFAIYGDAEVMRHASDPPFADRDTVRVMLASVSALLAEGRSLEWGVADRQTDRLIGTCGLHAFEAEPARAEVGCLLARSHWGRGLMREALEALFVHAREGLGLAVLRADIDVGNDRSAALFRRLGFRPVGQTLHERPA